MRLWDTIIRTRHITLRDIDIKSGYDIFRKQGSRIAKLFGILEILWISESQRNFVSLKISEKFHFFKDNIESKIPCVRTNLRFILHLRMISAQNQFIPRITIIC